MARSPRTALLEQGPAIPVVNKNVVGLIWAGHFRRKRAVSLARIGVAAAAQIEDVIGFRGKHPGLPPAIFSQDEMADARFSREGAGILQPVIEPAKQNRVGIEQRLGAEIRGSDAIAPRNVHPRPGDQVLMIAREVAARIGRKRQESVGAASHVGVIPPGNMQRGHADLIQALGDIERGPIFAGLIVSEPIERVLRQPFAVECGMLAKRKHAGLRREIRPRLFEPVARLAQFLAPRVRFQQLNPPAERCCQAQRSLVIKPALVEIAGGHPGRDALQTFGIFGGSQKLRDSLIGKTVHADAPVRFRPRAQPGNRVRAVVRFVAERIEFAAGIAAPANVLDNHVVSAPCKPDRMRVHDGGSNVPPVRLPHQESRVGAGLRWVVMIGNQFHGVARAATRAALQAHAVAAIDQRGFAHALWRSEYRAIASKAAARRVAACSSQRSPFSAEAGRGSPSTPLSAMSRVSQANVAGAFSGSSISGAEMSAM